MKFLDGKDVYFKASFFSLLVTIILFLASLFLFAFNLGEVPLTILVSGLFVSWHHFLYSKTDSKNVKITVALNASKMVLLVSLAFIFAYLYFKTSFRLLNPFTFIGIYFVSTVAFVIFARKDKKNG